MIELNTPCNVVVAGSTKAGKTHLTKKILKEQILPKTDYLIILSPTCDISDDWDEFPEQPNPDLGLVIQKFSADFKNIIEEMIDSQRALLRTHKKNNIPSITIVIDDCLGRSILRLGGLLDKFSVSSRHYNMTMFVLVQKIVGCPRTFRLNSAYCVLFNCSNFTELERFISEYVPKKYKKMLENHIEQIYNEDYNFILTENFNKKLKNRLLLNGEENIFEMF
jgi:hypothetical protein